MKKVMGKMLNKEEEIRKLLSPFARLVEECIEEIKQENK